MAVRVYDTLIQYPKSITGANEPYYLSSVECTHITNLITLFQMHNKVRILFSRTVSKGIPIKCRMTRN